MKLKKSKSPVTPGGHGIGILPYFHYQSHGSNGYGPVFFDGSLEVSIK